MMSLINSSYQISKNKTQNLYTENLHKSSNINLNNNLFMGIRCYQK